MAQFGNSSAIRTVALAVTYDATISTSTQITLNAATTIIEVTAIDKTVLLKWGSTSASTTVWDVAIPLNTTKQLYVPYQSDGKTRFTTVNLIEEVATAKMCVAEY